MSSDNVTNICVCISGVVFFICITIAFCKVMDHHP